MKDSAQPQDKPKISAKSFLGIEKSVTGRRWVGLSPEIDRRAQALDQQFDLPDMLCRVLARQGVLPDGVEGYLTPRLRDLMPDPYSLLDMETAALRFVSALEKQEKIAIFADYDVDGAGSAAQLITWLRRKDHTATLYIPHRIGEGYGPNPQAIAKLSADHSLIICVDCGTSGHEALAAATGSDIIVLDHHSGDVTLPPAIAVVNPNRQDETSELSYLCAAGVVFMFLVAVNRILRRKGISEPDLWSMLDLVACATVADVVPLVGLNRAFVRQGLRVAHRRDRPGLSALADVARLYRRLDTYHLGYVIGPRINAGGRMGQSELGTQLLCLENYDEAVSLAYKLDRLNRERQQLVNQIHGEAFAQAECRGLDGPLVWAAGDWNPGVLGIVASRLMETANRPAIVIGLKDNIGKGSGRSIPGIDLGAVISRCRLAGTLLDGGGHKMAAGLTVEEARLEQVMEFIGSLLAKQGAHQAGPGEFRIDGAIAAGAVNLELIESLSRAGPYGAGSPPPRFAFARHYITQRKRIKDAHLKFAVGDDCGGKLGAMAFNSMDTSLGPFLLNSGRRPVHVAGRLEIDTGAGKNRPILHVQDAAPV